MSDGYGAYRISDGRIFCRYEDSRRRRGGEMVEPQWGDPGRGFFREPVTCPLEYFETVGPVDKAAREQGGFAPQGAVFGSPNVECRDGNSACGIRQIVGERAIPVQCRGKRARFTEAPHVV